ncbi:MAG: cytochrome biosis protein [Patescibacteria group bacterium]|nr:cytochrome biosis protein [Patescibacteria group bacterium]
MEELFASFFAGILTVAAPCVLPLLPVIVGGSLASGQHKKSVLGSSLTVVAGLIVSVIAFTLLLKATTSLLGIPQEVWQIVSGIIVLFFGLNFLFPEAWSKISLQLGFQSKSDDLLEKASHGEGFGRNFLMGAALGPVFNSCSPTYALIVAIILPKSFTQGLAHLTAYAVGLGLALLLIAILGKSAVGALRPLANPTGWLRKSIGILFILVALLVLTGLDKKFQAYALEQGWYDSIARLEERL